MSTREFDPQLNQDIVNALLNDSTLAMKEKTKAIRGKCPQCNKNSLWTRRDKPWFLNCDHEGSCGFNETVKERYPDLFTPLVERYPATEMDPKATARAYVQYKRGFENPRITEWYTQGIQRLPNGQAAETIKFEMCPGMTWERIIDDKLIKEAGGGKTRINKQDSNATYSGECWQPPGQTINKSDNVYIVEGIFCAIAMTEAGFKAVAAFSSSNFPRKLVEKLKDQDIRWKLAYDDEPGAHKYIKKYAEDLKVKYNQRFDVLLTGSKSDWNDAWKAQNLNAKYLEQCVWNGRIFMATEPKRKAYALYGKKKFTREIIEFGDNLHSVKFSQEEFNKASQGEDFDWGYSWDFFNIATKVKCISNCIPTFMYVQKDKLTDDRLYFFSIKKAHVNRSFLGAFSGSALGDPRAFNNALMNHSDGATFDGNAGDLIALRQLWLNRKVDSVQTIPHVGYDENCRSYVFPEFGFKDGKYVEINDFGYLQMGDEGIKTTLAGMPICNNSEFNGDWFNDFVKVFDLNGVVALGYFTASLFARQIKERQQAFTFLEITGDPDAGKSTLIRFLWKLLGRDNTEGIDLLSVSESSYGRHMGKVSNMPMVITESDREKSDGGRPAKSIDWDIFKKVYDLDGVIDSRGVKTNDNTTLDRVFRGTLVISQNATVQASTAMLSRIVHLHCTTAHKRLENRPLADRLKTMPVEELAGYLQRTLACENQYLARYFECFAKHRQTLSENTEITEGRIIDCHAQAMASVDALQVIFPNLADSDLHRVFDHTVARACDRQGRLRKDHPIVEQFWESYHFINDQVMFVSDQDGEREVDFERLNHSCDPGLIAINLNEFFENRRKRGQELTSEADLKQLLPTSQRYPFVEAKKVRSRLFKGRSTRCWVFKRSGGAEQ